MGKGKFILAGVVVICMILVALFLGKSKKSGGIRETNPKLQSVETTETKKKVPISTETKDLTGTFTEDQMKAIREECDAFLSEFHKTYFNYPSEDYVKKVKPYFMKDSSEYENNIYGTKKVFKDAKATVRFVSEQPGYFNISEADGPVVQCAKIVRIHASAETLAEDDYDMVVQYKLKKENGKWGIESFGFHSLFKKDSIKLYADEETQCKMDGDYMGSFNLPIKRDPSKRHGDEEEDTSTEISTETTPNFVPPEVNWDGAEMGEFEPADGPITTEDFTETNAAAASTTEASEETSTEASTEEGE